MQELVYKYIPGCVLCRTSKPNNQKLWLYMPLLVLNRARKSFTMDFFVLWRFTDDQMNLCLIVRGCGLFQQDVSLFLARRPPRVTTQLTCSSQMYGHILDCHIRLCLIKILDLWANFGQLYGKEWTLYWSILLQFIPRPMDKPKLSTEIWCSC